MISRPEEYELSEGDVAAPMAMGKTKRKTRIMTLERCRKILYLVLLVFYLCSFKIYEKFFTTSIFGVQPPHACMQPNPLFTLLLTQLFNQPFIEATRLPIFTYKMPSVSGQPIFL